MGVSVELDMQAIGGLVQAALQSAEVAMGAVISDMINTVPLDNGDLQNSIYVDKRKVGDDWHVFIDHGMLYARYLYFGNLMIDPETKSAWARKDTEKVVTDKKLKFKNGRTDHWFEPYLTGEKKDFVQNAFAEDFKRRTGV